MKSGDRYLEITYGDKPYTGYPRRLAEELCRRYNHEAKQLSILDLGAGRGELSAAFANLGHKVVAVDQAEPTVTVKNFEFFRVDLESPLPDSLGKDFDLIFSKSVVEHFYYPEKVLSQAQQLLKPGGLMITMTPSWIHNKNMFFDDFTHRTPFTNQSLEEIHEFVGLSNSKSEYFIQLPFTWKSRAAKQSVMAMGKLIPSFLKTKAKFFRFSKEVMLLCSSVKPSEPL